MGKYEQNINASEQEHIIIRMQLYKEVYVLNQGDIRNYAGNIAKDRAEIAVAAFDCQFDE